MNITAGYSPQKPPFMSAMGGRKLKNDAISLITTGNGFFDDGQSQQRVKGPCLLFQPKDQWHCTDPDDHGWDEYWVLFDAENAEQRFGKLWSRRLEVVLPKNAARIAECFQSLCLMIHDSKKGQKQHICFLFHQLLMEIYQDIEKCEFLNSDPNIDRAKKLIQKQHHAKHINWRELSASLGLSYDAFRMRFQRETGRSPNQYLIELKISDAVGYLRDTTLPINKIADILGIEDAYYFSKLFKKKTGKSPNLFRKSIFIDHSK